MKKLLVIFFSVLLIMSLQFVGGAKESAGAPIQLRLAHMNALEEPIHKWCVKFKELVEAKTNGNITVSIYPAAQLGDDNANLESLLHGALDIVKSNAESQSKIIPDWGVFPLPFLFENYEHAAAAADGKPGQILKDKLFNEKGVRTLCMVHSGFRDMLTVDKEINRIEDFKGVKFRSPPIPVYVEMFKALGASPTPIPWPETYSAMKSKVCDGLETTPAGMWAAKMYEVSKIVTVTHHLYTVDTLLIREKVLQDLSPELRKAVLDAAAETQDWGRKFVLTYNSEVYDKLRGVKMKVNEIQPAEKKRMREACYSVWKKLSADTPQVMELADMIVKLSK
jgi:TRAP-type transport system periplasmic protein